MKLSHVWIVWYECYTTVTSILQCLAVTAVEPGLFSQTCQLHNALSQSYYRSKYIKKLLTIYVSMVKYVKCKKQGD